MTRVFQPTAILVYIRLVSCVCGPFIASTRWQSVLLTTSSAHDYLCPPTCTRSRHTCSHFIPCAILGMTYWTT